MLFTNSAIFVSGTYRLRTIIYSFRFKNTSTFGDFCKSRKQTGSQHPCHYGLSDDVLNRGPVSVYGLCVGELLNLISLTHS